MAVPAGGFGHVRKVVPDGVLIKMRATDAPAGGLKVPIGSWTLIFISAMDEDSWATV
jgi:hypothetical protein